MSLASWSRSQPDVTGALVKLGSLPRARHGVQPPPPLVIDEKEAYHRACARAGYPGHLAPEIRGAPIVELPLEGVHTIQSSVNPDRVAQYLRNPGTTPYARNGHTGPVEVPIVVRAGGVRYLHDGHTRSTAAILRGEARIRARFVDLDRR